MAPRPRKPRNVSCQAAFTGDTVYKPPGKPLKELEVIIVEGDEIEALHLCDGVGMTQDEAGESMGVSRGTVQRLLSAARKKVATALSAEAALVIKSGYDLPKEENG